MAQKVKSSTNRSRVLLHTDTPRVCNGYHGSKKFGTREKHPRWAGGRSRTYKGYVRVTAGPNRHKYEHRVVIEQLIQNPIGLVFFGLDGIPETMHVHHVDSVRSHNCAENLMLLDSTIHNFITRAAQKYYREHWNDPPAWVIEETA